MSDWGHDWIEKGRRFQGLIAQAKVWETTCDAGGPLMIFIPQGFPKEIPSRAADASEYPGQREGCARGGSSSRQKEEEGEDTHREQEGTKHVAYRSRRLRERNSNPHSLRQSAGQRGGNPEREPTAYSIW